MLNALGLHVYVLLDFERQHFPIDLEQAAQLSCKNVQFLEISVQERKHLGQERIQFHMVGESTAKVSLLSLLQVGEPAHRQGESRYPDVVGRNRSALRPQCCSYPGVAVCGDRAYFFEGRVGAVEK